MEAFAYNLRAREIETIGSLAVLVDQGSEREFLRNAPSGQWYLRNHPCGRLLFST